MAETSSSSTVSRPCSRPTNFPDPRESQSARFKTENSKLKERLAALEQTINELTDFRAQALARLATQYEEIVRLREAPPGQAAWAAFPHQEPQ